MSQNHFGRAKPSVGVLILTYNEESNLPRALEGIQGWASRIVIIDSFSTDRTVEIGRAGGCDVFQNKFTNHAAQINWGLQKASFGTEWILRLDADETATSDLREELSSVLPHLEPDITGIYIRRRLHFMGRWMKHGCYYRSLRMWRKGAAVCEARLMDEHMRLLQGRAVTVKGDIVDENARPLTWWIEKHNRYATLEAIELLRLSDRIPAGEMMPGRLWGPPEARRRWLKRHVYARSPLFVRAFMYFFYRYILRLGFLDGPQGLIWHFLQSCWYRFLVDAKVYEVRKLQRQEHLTTQDAVRKLHGIDL